MIERYTRPEMSEIWQDRNRFLIWLEIEKVVCEKLAHDKVIPAADWKKLKSKLEALKKAGGVDPKKVQAIEAITKHDVLAFTTAVAEKIGPESRYVHFGLTSSDVVDTAFSIQIQLAGAILRQDFESLRHVLLKKAKKYQKLATIGRTHGMFAEPTTYGMKFLGWAVEWQRNLDRLDASLERMRTGKLSGAVGVNAHASPQFETEVLKELGLRREKVSTQILPRDHHAEFLSVLAIAGGSLERIAIELRHLQRSEVAEVREAFSSGQKGSSAMPHKRNPISSENLTGAARLLRSYAQAGMENIALWHERDISHSSVERVVFPDATILLDYAVHRMTGLLEGLVVDEKRVAHHLAQAGEAVFSGHLLLELVRKGATREDAYAWIQKAALKSIDDGTSFLHQVLKEPQVTSRLSSAEIRRHLSLEHQLRHVGEVFSKA